MKRTRLLGASLICILISAENTSNAAAINTYSDRLSFSQSVGFAIIDDYENSGYASVMTDSEMSSVIGETTYYTYGGNISDYNNVQEWSSSTTHVYCSLCYGSFILSFDGTSVSDDNGVYGVGIDIAMNSNTTAPYFAYSAKVTFGDGTMSVFGLPYVGPDWQTREFWGITSNLGILSIDFMSYSSVAVDPNRTFLQIDNLTIAASPVPTPTALYLFGSGLLGLIGMARKKLA